MPFNNTPGDPDANSYPDVAYFRAYSAARLPAVDLTGVIDATIEAWLQAGTREIDACFDWTGVATAPDTQALGWPRSGMLNRNSGSIANDAIPTPLKDATCEFVVQMRTQDRLSDNEPIKKGITSIKAGSIALTFADVLGGNKRNPAEAADVNARLAQSDLNYLSDVVPDEVRRLLVESWFNQNMVTLPLVFEAF